MWKTGGEMAAKMVAGAVGVGMRSRTSRDDGRMMKRLHSFLFQCVNHKSPSYSIYTKEWCPNLYLVDVF